MRESLINSPPQVPLGFLEELAPKCSAPTTQYGCAYLQLSEAYRVEAEQSRASGWAVERFNGHHLSALTDLAGAARGIIDLALGLARRAPPAV